MPDRRETMGGYTAHQKIEYNGFFTIPDYRECAIDDIVKIPAHYEVCGTCRGTGKMVNPSIDSHGITQSEMEELGDDFREDYFSGVYDVVCSECRGARVILEPNRDMLTKDQKEALEAWEDAVTEEGHEIYIRNQGIQF